MKDLTIVELGAVLAIPAVGTFFAELGAKVIKVEPPTGDVTRSWKNSKESKEEVASAYFSSVNYGKEHQFLNLKDENDLAAVRTLCDSADIVLSNFKHGDDERYGLSYPTLAATNPKLIYGHLTGFRSDPERVAYDTVLQAETGFMHMNGYPEGLPSKMPVALIDVLGAHQLKEGILIALLEREQTGKGALVEVTLEEAALASLKNQASNYLMSGLVPGRAGTQHPNIAPYGDMYRTKDDQLIVLAIGNERQFHILCDLLNLPQLKFDERFQSNADRVRNRNKLNNLVNEAFRLQDSEPIMEAFNEHKVPAGLVSDLDHIFRTNPIAQELVLEEDQNGTVTKRVRSAVFRITPYSEGDS